MKWFKSDAVLWIFMASLWACCQCAVSEPLIYEGFDYDAASKASSWVGGVGLAKGWTHIDQPGEHTVKICDGLTFGNLMVSGNALEMYSAADSKGMARYSKLQRPLGISEISDGRVWVSYLIARTSGHSTGANAVRLMNGKRERGFTAEYKSFGMRGRPGMHLFGTTENGTMPTPNRDGEPMLVVAACELKKSASAQMWIFDVAGFRKLGAKIVEESLSSDDLESAAQQSFLLEDGGSIELKPSDFIEFFQQTKFTEDGDGGLCAVYDELRIGRTLLSVLPLGAGAAEELVSEKPGKIVFKRSE